MKASRANPLPSPISWWLVLAVLLHLTPAMSQSQPDNVHSALKVARVGESGGLWFTNDPKSDEARKHREVLTEWFRASWRQVLANYGAEAPTQREQVILVEVAETLPPREYLAYLNALLDQFKSGVVPQNTVESALTGQSVKLGFIAFNFSDQAIQSLVIKAQSTLPKDSALQDFLSAAKAGKLRNEAIMQRETAGMSAPETLPSDNGASAPSATTQLPTAQQSPKAATTTLPQVEESPTSTPWAIVIVMIAAAVGLL